MNSSPNDIAGWNEAAAGLVALGAQAERGETCPRVTLLTATGLVQGIPTSRNAFQDARRAAVHDALERETKARELRRNGTTIGEMAEPLLRHVDQARGSANHLYLSPAAVLPLSGSSLSVPALQVSLAHVIAWWLGRADVHDPKSYSASVGFILPM